MNMEKMDHTKNIIDSLSVIMAADKAAGKPFPARAYEKVIKNIASLSKPIYSMADLVGLKGIGVGISKLIEEIITTGSLGAAKEITENPENKILIDLQNVYGVGPVKAKDLYQKHNVRSITDLRVQVAKDPKLLTAAQKKGLHHYEDLLERIPREEMLQHEIKIALNPEKGRIVGSFRRCAKDSGDIDIMLDATAQELKEFANDLIRKGYLIASLASGSSKHLAICRLPGGKARRLDLIRCSSAEYPYMLLYFTGSDRFNVAFRKYCLTKGYSLNEHGFTPAVHGLKSEEDIFGFVGLAYKKPEERTGPEAVIQL